MNPSIAPATMEVLDRAECMRRLADAEAGRLAYVLHGFPHIEVVNFVVHEGCVLMRCDMGAKAAAVGRGHRLALEVDEISPATRTGWEVSVIGRAKLLSGAEANRLRELVTPWAPGPRAWVIRLVPESVFGRRINQRPVSRAPGD
jgi:nitroimidazol reductase NimA-like FMN-containing flavoprotein (pyridoxamine 5'-phosphate oxidase superfamily)